MSPEARPRRLLRKRFPPHAYHHIPCSAAFDFTRTATPQPSSPAKAHRLAGRKIEKRSGEGVLGRVASSASAPSREGIVVVAATDRPDWTEGDECGAGGGASSSVFGRVSLGGWCWGTRHLHGGCKGTEKVLPLNDEKTGNTRGGKIWYPWRCVCFF